MTSIFALLLPFRLVPHCSDRSALAIIQSAAAREKSLPTPWVDMSSPHIDTDTPPQDGCMPIAIVGLAFRGPGEATNDASFWDMISKGHDAHSTWPKDRFNIDAFYHPDPERSGTVNTREGHFMKSDVIGFDAPFFSISAKEAHALDPQHRLALELTYESLENGKVHSSPSAIHRRC